MDASTKKKGLTSKTEDTTPATTAEDSFKEEKKGPVKSIREGDVSVSIWSRTFKGRIFYSCSFERSYKDAQGQYRYTRYFGLDDLGKVMSLAQQASEYLHGLPDRDQD